MRTVAAAYPRPTLAPRSAGPRGSTTDGPLPGFDGNGVTPDEEPREADFLRLVKEQNCWFPNDGPRAAISRTAAA